MDLSLDEIKNTYAQIVVALKQWKFGNKAQLAFLEDLYTLVNEGIPANRAIDMIAQVTTGGTPSKPPPLRGSPSSSSRPRP